MIETRIIAMKNYATSKEQGVVCGSFMHSKFARRRKYVDEVLLPKMLGLGLKAEIFSAVTDADFAREENIITYQDLKLRIEYGSVGCFLSHVMLWRLCESLNCALFVLEDDASLPPEHEATVVDALRQYDALPDTGDILYMQGQLPYAEIGIHLYPSHTTTPLDQTSLLRVNSVHDLAGTAAYAIKPVAAKKLLDRITRIPMCAVDGFIHGAVNAKEIGVLVPADFHHVVMLHEHFAPWNHIHTPGAQ